MISHSEWRDSNPGTVSVTHSITIYIRHHIRHYLVLMYACTIDRSSSIPLHPLHIFLCPSFRKCDRVARSQFLPRLLTHYALIHSRICTQNTYRKASYTVPLFPLFHNNRHEYLECTELFWMLSSRYSAFVTYTITTYPALTGFTPRRACVNIFTAIGHSYISCSFCKIFTSEEAPRFSTQLSK